MINKALEKFHQCGLTLILGLTKLYREKFVQMAGPIAVIVK